MSGENKFAKIPGDKAYASEYNNFRRTNVFYMSGDITTNISNGYITNTLCKLRIGADIVYIIDNVGSTDARDKLLTINVNTPSTVWDTYKLDFDNFEYDTEYSVAGKETTPNNLFFKPDGTKMYVIGNQADNITEYTLNPAWDLASPTYVQQLSVGSKETIPTGLFFKPDGTKMYVCGTNGDTVDEYDLAVAWDISTATYLQEISISTQDTAPQSIWFNSDGDVMMMLGGTGKDVNRYTLGTPWDISTLSYSGVTSALTEAAPTGMSWNSTGTRCYIIGSTDDTIYEYSVSSAWTLTGWTATGNNISVTAKEIVPTGVYVDFDVGYAFTIGSNGDTVDRYKLNRNLTYDYVDIIIRDADYIFDEDEVVIGYVDETGTVGLVGSSRQPTFTGYTITTATDSINVNGEGYFLGAYANSFGLNNGNSITAKASIVVSIDGTEVYNNTDSHSVSVSNVGGRFVSASNFFVGPIKFNSNLTITITADVSGSVDYEHNVKKIDYYLK